MKKSFIVLICLALAVTFLSTPSSAEESLLMMATTTSTDNTGLLDYLAPKFKADTGIELKWTATGTGKALKLGENCDVDVLLVHAPAAEKKFVADGFGSDRKEIMYNDFVVIGPAEDPAGIKGQSIKEAFGRIQAKQAVFASRGDNSGTHKKELALWKAAEMQVPEKEKWYVQTGQGMLSTINIAAEQKGYTMTDRGTYIKYEDTLKGNPPLKILVEGDAVLLNQYSVIAVDKKHCPQVKYDTAKRFIDWIAGPAAQHLIKEFKLLGKPLFTPNAEM
ncbi:tungsten ABC transporter substrate-binding protein [Desulfococcus multivorans]|uniref:PBP domain containing protein n=2 Tax=Desulfococcus multivorans TaxID=897 RepID=S7VD36_DESML|nr:substrate-binding domain-containing protein [Desulfococcus multivorans]AOY60219.1 putative ABC-type molybdate/tungstate transporter, periplasmic substrate binding protein [Desulfococcus multivorans]AQV02335.1 tungsten ABC transporter substrate-binding protein [Desulfococcus multivorans]EPR44609.1 PBP domain containing protein [Desulfococcus multivorans DSM 2059]SKA07054.1 tungstate transport system substrate-binding protein [Desulfococcus multivorans DSM 2059]